MSPYFWVLVALVLAIVVLVVQKNETFKADGWLSSYQLNWFSFPAFLNKDEKAPKPNQALTTLSFTPNSPTLVAIEHPASKTRLVMSGRKLDLKSTRNKAKDQLETRNELWAIIRSDKTERYQIRSASTVGESITIDDQDWCLDVSVPNKKFEDWIIEPANARLVNSFYIRTRQCRGDGNGKGLRYFLAANPGAADKKFVRMIPENMRTNDNSVWVFKKIVEGSRGSPSRTSVNRPTRANLPTRVNRPTRANLPASVNRPTRANLPTRVNLPTRRSLPTSVNRPTGVNLPTSVNRPTTTAVGGSGGRGRGRGAAGGMAGRAGGAGGRGGMMGRGNNMVRSTQSPVAFAPSRVNVNTPTISRTIGMSAGGPALVPAGRGVGAGGRGVGAGGRASTRVPTVIRSTRRPVATGTGVALGAAGRGGGAGGRGVGVGGRGVGVGGRGVARPTPKVLNAVLR